MATNLTGSTIASTYEQLLHVDGGPEATEKIVYSGTGTATALKLGTQSASVDNLKLDGNTLSSTNTNGDINITPNGTGTVVVSKADIQSGTIVSNNATITGGAISGVAFSGTFTGITSISADSFFTSDAAAGLTLTGNELTADGTDTDIDVELKPKGAGEVTSSGKLGYATGTGGTVTQATNKSTGVTLNKLSGQITMDSASLGHQTSVAFTLTNSFIDATDVVVVNIKSGGTSAAYLVGVTAVAAGSCEINLFNAQASSSLSEAVVLSFVVIKGVSA
jgi:hypothetical protein